MMVASLADSYSTKQITYFRVPRADILPLIPRPVDRVLEIGCGAGETLGLLKSRGLCRETIGVELVPAVAERARALVDGVYEGDVETMALPCAPESVDLILCLDVLEHLRDPWGMVETLRTLLKPGGALIASLPNVQHCKVVVPLLLRGRWDYMPAGLLDRTHLRFFTKATAIELLAGAGLRVTRVHASGISRFSAWWWLDRATLSLLRPLFTVQYLLRAER